MENHPAIYDNLYINVFPQRKNTLIHAVYYSNSIIWQTNFQWKDMTPEFTGGILSEIKGRRFT